MKKRAFWAVGIAVVITAVTTFLLKDRIAKALTDAWYRFYDWAMGIP